MIKDTLYKTIIKNLPILCVDLIIKSKEGKFLLVERKNEPMKGCWFVPGGRVLLGEKIIDAVKRKAREECGIEIGGEMAVGYFEYILENKHTVSIVCECRYISGEITLDNQSSDWKWSEILPEDLIINKFFL